MISALTMAVMMIANHQEKRQPLPESAIILEQHRRHLLQSVRDGRRMIETNVKQFESSAVLYEKLNWREDAEQCRKYADKARKHLPLYDEMERELLEQQPGGYTAPPPRPVNRKSPTVE